MKTKYVFRGVISLCVNFHNNRTTMWSSCKSLQVGGKVITKKSPRPKQEYSQRSLITLNKSYFLNSFFN